MDHDLQIEIEIKYLGMYDKLKFDENTNGKNGFKK